VKVSIGWSTPKKDNIMSWLIRKIQRSKDSHVWMLIEDSSFVLPLVLESHYEFRFVTYEKFKNENKIVTVMTPSPTIVSGIDAVLGDLGTGYDLKGTFGALFVVVGKWLKKKIHNPFSSPHRLFCSESVARVLVAAKYPGAELLVPEDTTPEDLMEFFFAPAKS
jgi:hypothetical protein